MFYLLEKIVLVSATASQRKAEVNEMLLQKRHLFAERRAWKLTTSL